MVTGVPLLDRNLENLRVDACAMALARLAQDLTASDRSLFAKAIRHRLSDRLKRAGGASVRRALDAATLGALQFVLGAFCTNAEPGSQTGPPAIVMRLKDLLSSLMDDPPGRSLLLGPMLSFAADPNSSSPEAQVQDASNGGPAFAVRVLEIMAAPTELPPSLKQFVSERRGIAEPLWLEAFAIHLAWQIKNEASLRYVLLPELESDDENVSGAAERFLQKLYDEARSSASGLAGHVGERDTAASSGPIRPPAPPAVAGSEAGSLWMVEKRMARRHGLSVPQETVASIEANGAAAWKKELELLAAIDALASIARFASSDANHAGPLRAHLDAAEHDLADILLSNRQEDPDIPLTQRCAFGLARAMLMLGLARYEKAAHHAVWCIEAQRATGLPPSADAAIALCWALCMLGQSNRSALAQAEQYLQHCLRLTFDSNRSTQTILTLIGAIVRADGLGEKPEMPRVLEVLDILRRGLAGNSHGETAEEPRSPLAQAVGRRALISLATLAWSAAQKQSGDAKALTIEASDAWLAFLRSDGVALTTHLRSDAACRASDALLQRDREEKDAGWAEIAFVLLSCAYLEIHRDRRGTNETASHRVESEDPVELRAMIDAMARAQGRLGQSKKSKYWLEQSNDALGRSLPPQLGARHVASLLQLGQNHLWMHQFQMSGPSSLEQARTAYESAIRLLPKNDHWRMSRALVGLSTSMLELGRISGDPAILSRCVEFAAHRSPLTGPPAQMNTLQLLGNAGEACQLQGDTTSAAAYFDEALKLARSLRSEWWERRLENKRRTTARTSHTHPPPGSG